MMTVLRILLSLFSLVNVAFWATLAWAWAVKPGWATRLPFGLGTDMRYKTPVPTWARLAAAVAAFWAVAGVIYLVVFSSDRVQFVALFVTAAIFLILGLGAAARIYRFLQLPNPAAMGQRKRAV